MEAEASELLAPLNVRLGDTLGSAWPRKSMHPLPRRAPLSSSRHGGAPWPARRGCRRRPATALCISLATNSRPFPSRPSSLSPDTFHPYFHLPPLLNRVLRVSLELIPRATAKGKLYQFLLASKGTQPEESSKICEMYNCSTVPLVIARREKYLEASPRLEIRRNS